MIDSYLLIGLVSLLGLFLFVLIDFDIPLGQEFEFSFKGILLGISFSSFTLFYIQSMISNNILLSIIGIVFFIIGYKILFLLMKFLKSGETGDVLSINSLINKNGTIKLSFEKNDNFFYEIEIEHKIYLAKSIEKLDEEKAILVVEINENNEIIIVNSDLKI